MSWQTTQDAIRAAVIASLELPSQQAKAVTWDGDAQAFGGKRVVLNVLAQNQEGPDRIVKTQNASGNFDVSVSALVVFTVTVRCEYVNGNALELCELARSGLALPSIKAALKKAGVVVVGYPTSPIPISGIRADERDVSAHAFDCFFRHEVNRKDPTAISTIEHVEVSGTANGAPLGAQTVNRP